MKSYNELVIALIEVKNLSKDFVFVSNMMKVSIAEGRKKK